MSIESLQQAKSALQSLTESLWIFSALSVMNEAGALAVLHEKMTLNTLEKITKLPNAVLEQTINLLIETGFLVSENEKIWLAPGMQELMEKIGLEKISAQLRVAFGLSGEFIKSSREKNLRAGWNYTDEVILQAQGTHSEYVITDCIPQDAKLQNLLNKSQALFLDVGAGVGKISLRLCQIYDNVKVVALEPADVPFSLAKKNIEEAKYANRIELRKMYLEDFSDKNSYDVVWFPHVFFPESTLNSCLAKVWDALKPGAMLITSAILPDKKNQSVYIRQLINSLYGGLRTADELTKALTDVGFQEIKVFSEISGYRTITASKPE